MSKQVVNQLLTEEYANEILMAAEQEIKYLTRKIT
jgi:hypothetical protein